jgi:triosephosphate isomerase
LNRPLIINCKNYLEVSSDKITELGVTSQSIAKEFNVEIVLAPPQPSLAAIARAISIPVICQHVDDANLGSTTGFFIPEMAKSYGSVGSLINHSEHKMDTTSISNLVQRLRKLNMTSIVCAGSPYEVSYIAKVNPDFIAIEPPDLIGSGKAVSKENPSVITNSIKIASENSASTKVICGAGIVDKSDVVSAIKLGAHGILVASGIIKANSWFQKISELASGFIS